MFFTFKCPKIPNFDLFIGQEWKLKVLAPYNRARLCVIFFFDFFDGSTRINIIVQTELGIVAPLFSWQTLKRNYHRTVRFEIA